MEGGKYCIRISVTMVMHIILLGPLFQRIKKQKSFTEQEACAVLKDVASAISFLHRKSNAYSYDFTENNTMCAYIHTYVCSGGGRPPQLCKGRGRAPPRMSQYARNTLI